MSLRRSVTPCEPLRGHVAQRADDVAGCGQALGPRRLARPKSVTQTLPCGVEQEVRRLDVAVQDALGVGVGQRLGHLDADPGHLAVVAEPPTGRSAPTGWAGSPRLAGPSAGRAAARRPAPVPGSVAASPGVTPGPVANRPVSRPWATADAQRQRPARDRGGPGPAGPRSRSRRTSSSTTSRPWPGMYCMA